MNRNPKNPKTEQDRDVNVEAAWRRLFDNKSDESENTFCFNLFEMNRFDEGLFGTLCEDMGLVIKNKNAEPKSNYHLLVWIISCIFRSIFSHLDKNDRYKIKNFDGEISEKWNADYLDRLRGLLDEIFVLVIEA